MEQLKAEKNAYWEMGMRIQTMMLETLSNDPHLTDAEIIEFSAGIIDPEEACRLQAHLGRCPQCSGEIERFMGQTAAWRLPGEIERREARIGRPQVMREQTPTPSWRNADIQWTSLAALSPRLSAMAADTETSVVSFSVTDGPYILTDLSGAIQRRGNEYYVRITADADARDLYHDRMVEVVLSSQDAEEVLLQRWVLVDRFILLGTDLASSAEKVAARLLP